MKKTKRLWALLLAMVMALGLISTAFAAPTIDSGRKASLSLYKYDITAASEDGAWNTASYVSTGVQDDTVTDKLAQYAIQGVEFTYLRVADIAMNNELVDGQRQVGVLYGFAEGTVLQAIGLTAADAHKSENGTRYYTADKLNKAMSDALTANATTVKNALEAAARNGGKAMPETDENGHSKVSGLEQGLYLVVETRVPENVTSTCNPFFVSLPMTTIDGKGWNYDVTVYPKNQTGSPNLEKTVREDKNSTGKNTGSLTDIADGYAHTATASVGDVVDYQIISTLPTITSKATSLTTYTFADTMSEGIRYNRSDVIIEFFRDAGCTDQITAWDEDSGKFAVSYDDAANTMTIGMTETGLAEINESEGVYTDSVKRGYSDCTMRITYAATLTAGAQLGDSDNPNEVVLTWKRTNTGYFDTLQDCCHVYTYGVDVMKQFSDGKGDLANVHFLLHNDTDDVYVIAEQRDGMYYVKGFTGKKADATTFVPNDSGHIIVNGLEDDTYTFGQVLTPELLQYKISQYPEGVGDEANFIRSHWLNRRTTDCVGLIKGYGWLNTETMEIQYGSNGMPDVGADGMYYNAGRKGSIETMPDTPGLAVWKSGHIGVYIGSGEVIEAMDTRYGVVKTKLQGRGWSHWLEVPGIKYD